MTDDTRLDERHAVRRRGNNSSLNTPPLFSGFFPRQRGLRRRSGQKCRHQEAEQTLPEPDPRQEGIPGVGAHEMRQSQKCKCVVVEVGEICNPVGVYFRSLINPFCYKMETSDCNVVAVLNSRPPDMYRTGRRVKRRALGGINVISSAAVLCSSLPPLCLLPIPHHYPHGFTSIPLPRFTPSLSRQCPSSGVIANFQPQPLATTLISRVHIQQLYVDTVPALLSCRLSVY